MAGSYFSFLWHREIAVALLEKAQKERLPTEAKVCLLLLICSDDPQSAPHWQPRLPFFWQSPPVFAQLVSGSSPTHLPSSDCQIKRPLTRIAPPPPMLPVSDDQ